jgi:integrase
VDVLAAREDPPHDADVAEAEGCRRLWRAAIAQAWRDAIGEGGADWHGMNDAKQQLKAEQIQKWHKDLLDQGLSPVTIKHANTVLKLVFGRAIENKVLTANVAIRKLPKAIEILLRDQIAALLEGLSGHMLHPIASLALATGMRRGELLALEWSDVDLDSATVTVTHSLEETQAAGLRVKSTKTGKPRPITLPQDAVDMLRTHRAAQMRLRLELGQGGPPTLVFSTVEGAHIKPDSLSRFWHQTLVARKLPQVKFHGLRHQHASTLIKAGVDILTISRRLGHSKASMTLDIYGHLIEGADAAAAKAIEGMLK